MCFIGCLIEFYIFMLVNLTSVHDDLETIFTADIFKLYFDFIFVILNLILMIFDLIFMPCFIVFF